MPHPFELQLAREFLLKRSTILFGALSLALVAIKILLQFGLTDVPPPRTGGCVHLALPASGSSPLQVEAVIKSFSFNVTFTFTFAVAGLMETPTRPNRSPSR